jgi:Uma2 family endonuclease
MATQPQTKYWTYEDLLALPDDGRRYEIIEGVLCEMPSPNMEHDDLIANLLHRVLWPVVDGIADTFMPCHGGVRGISTVSA